MSAKETSDNVGSKNRRSSAVRSGRKPRATIIVFGICRLGFLLAVFAHALLFIGALWMVFVEKKTEYLFFLGGYGLLTGLFAEKTVALFRQRRGRGTMTHSETGN